MKLYRFTLTPQSAMGTPLVGDTFFGQFCWAVRNRFGEARLIELLEGYTEQRPFIVVSDAFPQGFLPLPTLPSTFWEKLEHDRKQLKKAQFIKVDDAQQNDVKNWQGYALSEYLQLQEKIKNDKTGEEKKKWGKTTQDQFHNTIDRQTNTTGEGQFAPYSTDIAWFGSKQEFDLYIVLDEARCSLEELQQILDDVGAFGFGRDASIGLGKFRCNNPQEVNFYQQNANCYFTLANSAPQNLGLNKECSYYQITTRFGRHGDIQALSSSPFKKPIILAKSAAIFTPENYEPRLFLGNGLGNVSYAQPEAVHQGYAPVLNLFVDFEHKDHK
ncbi:type III-A CRISPR-associated RAMP protein Csm4 [Haemophilus parainfluenzae]|uniref:type III-A CRISPR-associated RAMP protein Csm4 n=1 Tax=Haemophilus parainfluenzae TaxID=729 RepID=UPI000962E0AD|nr:RAMP superfamily CRISPR-associated protein [Haemophilus parainfluenzae]OLV28084.1 CRISPR-associated protein Csm4 [Haemophilus parainfluenzae]